MNRDIPLVVFLTAIGIVLLLYLRAGRDTERYDLTDTLRNMAAEIEESVFGRTMAQLEEPEHYE